jgi:hypothetical protein
MMRDQVLSEIVAAAGADPTMTVEQAGILLGEMYAAAEAAGDQERLLAVYETWQHIQKLQTAADTGVTLATAAREMVIELESQRDFALEVQQRMMDAVANADTSVPAVQALVERVEEQIHAEIEESIQYGDFYYSPDPAEDIKENFPDICLTKANKFHGILVAQWLDELNDQEKRAALVEKITCFIDSIVDEYDEAMELQFQDTLKSLKRWNNERES